MAETIEEQIEYGDRCTPHGNPVGTPGGADIMCSLCEGGLTNWVPDQSWVLWIGPKGGQIGFSSFRFRESEYSNPSQTTLRRMVSMKKFLDMFGTEDEALKPFVYEMHRSNEGYWTE